MKLFYGFTLIEACIVLTISSILALFTIPTLTNYYRTQRANVAINRIYQALSFARNHAITYSQSITLCPNHNQQCGDNWLNGILIFTDSDTIKSLDNKDKIIHLINAFNQDDIISYRKDFIHIKPNGTTPGFNGTFTYCPSHLTHSGSKAIIINRSGRIRFSDKAQINCH